MRPVGFGWGLLSFVARTTNWFETGGVMRSAGGRRRLLVAALGGWAISCGGGGGSLGGENVCTLVWCQDQFTAVVTVSPTAIPAGTHTLDVTADGADLSCMFTIPPTGSAMAPTCTTGLSLYIASAQPCPPADAAGGTCLSIDRLLEETITVAGTPSTVRVRQLVGGTAILDQTVSPAYQVNQPNGPGCGPICQQGRADWSLP